MTTLYFDVSAQNYSCQRKVSYFSGEIAKCHWLRILRIGYMKTLHFDVLAQNYCCLRIVSYFSSKIGLVQRLRISRISQAPAAIGRAFWGSAMCGCCCWCILRVSCPLTATGGAFWGSSIWRLCILGKTRFGQKLPLFAKSFIFQQNNVQKQRLFLNNVQK